MSDELEFTKMHGAGNDFVILDGTRFDLPSDLEAFSRRIADRHFGIGADQVLVLRPASGKGADVRMDIYDADGSEVEMCGNGVRAVLKYLRDRGRCQGDEIGVETLSGVVRPRWLGADRVRVDMGVPILEAEKIPTTLGSGDGPVLDARLELDGGPVVLSCASIGNPHAVIVVEDVDAVAVEQLGPAIENHPAFPDRVNVEFIQIVDRGRVRQRTWERGTGETLACGSGACAVAVVSILRGVVDHELRVELRGGELELSWQGGTSHVFMTGPAAEVFTGHIPTSED